MAKKCLLNNMRMNKYRTEPVYHALLIDLALCGAVDKKLAEQMLGYEIPKYIRPLVTDEVSSYGDDTSADE